MPSSRRQTLVTAAALTGPTSNSGQASAARSANNRTASASGIAGTGHLTSPGTRSTSLLVASRVLLVVAVLNIYKPQGVTRHGWRKQQERRVAVTQRRNRRPALT